MWVLADAFTVAASEQGVVGVGTPRFASLYVPVVPGEARHFPAGTACLA